MRRLLRNLLCGSCAFLCAGFVAMWVRSHLLEPEGVTWAARDDSARSVGVIALSSAGGCVGVRRAWSKGPGLPPEQWVELMGDFDAGWRFDEEVDPRPNDPKTFRYYRNGHYHAGFGWGSRRVVFGRDLFGGEWFVAAPYWALTVLAAAPPAWRGGTAARARRRRCRGLCARCGYDLRASPQRCPECGWEAAAPT